MDQAKSKFKKPSRKHQPAGVRILHEDRDIIVVDKVDGILTVANDRVREKTAYANVMNYVQKGNPKSKNRIFLVHRLSRETSGILIFAKTEAAKKHLQDNWKNFTETYITIVHGHLEVKTGEISNFLLENKAKIMYATDDSDKGKFAKTAYKVVKETSAFSLLEVRIFTNTKNQIRVHMADLGHPIAGDKRYGEKRGGVKRLALHAYELNITHPFSKKPMQFKTEFPKDFNAILKK